MREKYCFTGRAARVLRLIYAVASAAAALGILIVCASLLAHNTREAAILLGCVSVLAVIRTDVYIMDAEKRKERKRRNDG